jgi:CubicO group peptidase (beta-lactamase class C family)
MFSLANRKSLMTPWQSRKAHRLAYCFHSLLALVLFAGALSAPLAAQERVFPGRTWEGVNQASSGWNAQGLQQAQEQFRQMGSSAVVIVHNGRVVQAWGDFTRPIKIHSARKSLMSALYGIAVAQKQVYLDWTLQDLRIDDLAPSLTPQEKQAKVRHLLMARSGVYHEAAAETRSMRERRPQRGSHAPGSFWYYNNWDFNVLGAILRNVTREDTFSAFERYFARPLGMEEFTAANGQYVTIRASQYPAYHMRFSARDLARFGWLFANGGRWGDRQIVPAEWVAESTRAWTPDARKGISYGYMWWVAQDGRQYKTDTGAGSFSARGSGGQILIVAPARGIVVAHLNDQEENEKLERGEFDRLLQLIFAAAPPPR